MTFMYPLSPDSPTVKPFAIGPPIIKASRMEIRKHLNGINYISSPKPFNSFFKHSMLPI